MKITVHLKDRRPVEVYADPDMTSTHEAVCDVLAEQLRSSDSPWLQLVGTNGSFLFKQSEISWIGVS